MRFGVSLLDLHFVSTDPASYMRKRRKAKWLVKARDPPVASPSTHPWPCPGRRPSPRSMYPIWRKLASSDQRLLRRRRRGSTKPNIVDSTSAAGTLLMTASIWKMISNSSSNGGGSSSLSRTGVGEKDYRAHHCCQWSGQGSRHVRRTSRRFSWQCGSRPLLMHMGEVSHHQRYHRRNNEHLHGKHEEKVRRTHERQLAGPLQFILRRKTTVGILWFRTTWWGSKFNYPADSLSIDG